MRQEGGRGHHAVGAISEADHVNSIIAASRADLCAIAHPHLANPAWTLTEATSRLPGQPWPHQYQSAKSRMEATSSARRRKRAGPGLAQVAAQKKSAKAWWLSGEASMRW
ncbi:MAG: hypothetical protein IPJ08_07120 [Burkholderiales bacterium]|nr:hypothetical protein [Burkholderiales bacterium]